MNEITNEDLRKLGELTTRDEAGTHFTQRYSSEWLEKMEQAGMIKIHKPIHTATKLEYSEEYWSVEVTPEGVAEGEARNWGEDDRPDLEAIAAMSPGEAWEQYVGTQSAQKFMEYSFTDNIDKAVHDYIMNDPGFQMKVADDDAAEAIAAKLAAYIRAQLA